MTQTFDLADEAGRRFLAVAGLVFDFLSIINLSLSDFKGYHKHDPISSSFLAVAGLVFDFLSIINLSLSDFKGYHNHDPISSAGGGYFLKLRNGAVFS